MRTWARSGAMQAFVAFVMAVGAWQALFAWARWRHPGGSSFPPGPPLGVLLSVASVVLAVLALRRREGVVTALVCVLAVVLALGCLAYFVAAYASGMP